MNVDLLRDNPRWTTYFYIAVPLFICMLLSVLLLEIQTSASEISEISMPHVPGCGHGYYCTGLETNTKVETTPTAQSLTRLRDGQGYCHVLGHKFGGSRLPQCLV